MADMQEYHTKIYKKPQKFRTKKVNTKLETLIKISKKLLNKELSFSNIPGSLKNRFNNSTHRKDSSIVSIKYSIVDNRICLLFTNLPHINPYKTQNKWIKQQNCHKKFQFCWYKKRNNWKCKKIDLCTSCSK